MITLLHGDNIVASRKELDFYKAKAQDKEITILDGNKINKTSLIQALESKTLLGSDRHVIIESLLSAKKKLVVVDILEKNSNQEITLWEGREIDKAVVNKLPKGTLVKLFKFEKILFKFLESIRPGRVKDMLFLFQETLKTEKVEIVFYMLIRQFRNLIIVKDLSKNKIQEIPDWQIRRLTNQGRYFTIEQLLENYRKLLEIDIGQKTGTTAYDLKKTIELFLLDI